MSGPKDSAAAATRRQVADALPQVVVEVEPAGESQYRLTALLQRGAKVSAVFDSWHYGSARRADGRSFIRRVVAHHERAGIPFAHMRRRDGQQLWVRVAGVNARTERGMANAVTVAESYLARLGLAQRAELDGHELRADRSVVFHYALQSPTEQRHQLPPREDTMVI